MFAVGDWTLRYYPPAKKCKLDSPWLGPYLVVSLASWAVGVQLHQDSPVLLIHCQDLKKIPRPKGPVSWLHSDTPDSSATHPILGASMVCRSTLGSAPSTLSDIRPQQSLLWIPVSPPHTPASLPNSPEFPLQASTSLPRSRDIAILTCESSRIDDTHVLHPFFHHRFDVGPIHLTSAHAFNYRIAVLRGSVKPAVCIGHSRRSARQILDNVDIPWSQQVAVMLQIVCALALDVPEVLHELEQLRGISPNVQLFCEPWGHINHEDNDCVCLLSDCTGAYIHKLSVALPSQDLVSVPLLPPHAASARLSHVPEGRLPAPGCFE